MAFNPFKRRMSVDPFKAFKKKKEEEKKEEKKDIEVPKAEPSPSVEKPSVMRSGETGALSGVQMPSGKVFLGLTPEDVKGIVGRHRERTQLPEGAKEMAERPPSQKERKGMVGGFLERVGKETEKLPETLIQQEQAAREERGQAIKSAGVTSGFQTGMAGLINTMLDIPTSLPSQDPVIPGSAEEKILVGRMRGNVQRDLDRFLGRSLVLAGQVDILGLSIDPLMDVLTNREDISQLESSMGKLGEDISAIRGIVDSGGISAEVGLAKLNKKEQDMNIVESRIKQAAILDPKIKHSGEYLSVLQEVEKTRDEMHEGRSDILDKMREERPDFDPIMTQIILEQLEERYESVLGGEDRFGRKRGV